MGWILTEVGSVPENVEFWLPFVAIFESCDASDTTQVFGNKHACRSKLNFQKPGKLRQKYGPGKKALLGGQKAEDKKTEQVTSGRISTVALGASSRSHTRLSSVHFGENKTKHTISCVFPNAWEESGSSHGSSAPKTWRGRISFLGDKYNLYNGFATFHYSPYPLFRDLFFSTVKLNLIYPVCITFSFFLQFHNREWIWKIWVRIGANM